MILERYGKKNLVLWLIIAAVLLMVFQNFSPTTTGQQVNYSQFVEMVQQGQVRQVTIDGLQVQGVRNDAPSSRASGRRCLTTS